MTTGADSHASRADAPVDADGGDVRAERTARKAAPAKKTAAKKTAAKKTAAKKAAVKAPAKRAASARRTAPAKKTAAPAHHGLTVAVTGAASGLGLAVAAHLAASDTIGKVIAIDAVRGHVAGVSWRLADVRDSSLAHKLDGVDALVHLAIDFDAGGKQRERHDLNVDGTAGALNAAAAAGVAHVVVVTSAMVYGAEPDNAIPLPEDAPLRAIADDGLLGDLLDIEDLAARGPRTHPGLGVSVVRPAALVGPGIDSLLTRHFESPALLAVRGAHPAWQFCHVGDLAAAVETVLAAGPDGARAIAVGSDGWLDHDALAALAGKRQVELPAQVAFATAARLHRVGLTPTADTDLRYLMYPWAVESAWLHRAGWSPRFSNADALRAQLAESAGRYAIGGHRLGRRDAAAGAAGATIALLGTAALVRRARRRRG